VGLVLPDGSVAEVSVTRSLDKIHGLDAEAVRTVRQWTFKPLAPDSPPQVVAFLVPFRFDALTAAADRPRPFEDPFAEGAYGAGMVGLREAQALRKFDPIYTANAIRARVHDKVVVEAIVLPNGTVGKVRVVESLDMRYGGSLGLDDAALKAVKQGLYRPALLNGHPVASLVTETEWFRPN
jgi:TonB family protein